MCVGNLWRFWPLPCTVWFKDYAHLDKRLWQEDAENSNGSDESEEQLWLIIFMDKK